MKYVTYQSIRFSSVYERTETCLAGLIVLMLTLASQPSLHAQSLTVFGIDASAYPKLRANMYAFDAGGRQITDISDNDVQILENGVPRALTLLSCPAPIPSTPISSVLTIDISGSMSGQKLIWAKAAAHAWIEGMSLGISECAITSFNQASYINQDFTTSKDQLLAAVDSLKADGGTSYVAGFLSPPCGALPVSANARSRRVVVLLSDGLSGATLTDAIIAEAQRLNAVIHVVVLGTQASEIVTRICAGTGGLFFDNVRSKDEAEQAYRQILYSTNGNRPCTIEWTTDGCTTVRPLRITLSSAGLSTDARYMLAAHRFPVAVFSPSQALQFGEVPPGTRSLRDIRMTAKHGDVRILSASVGNPVFRIVDYGGPPPPFLLKADQSRRLTMEFAPSDSDYVVSSIEFVGECQVSTLFLDGGWRRRRKSTAKLRVTQPNGGELFVAGSEVELSWSGVMPGDTVHLEYSSNSGADWNLISEHASGLKHVWKTPLAPSDSCLLRVTAWVHGDMVLIPAGSFIMGDLSSFGNPDEQHLHEVTISQPFLMGRTEVTQGQYKELLGKNPSWFSGDDLPVECVTWDEAVAYCNALSVREYLDPCYSKRGETIECDFSANGYRLPTEAEWEYACRSGSRTDFNTGDMLHSGLAPLDPALDKAGWYGGNGNHSTRPVGRKTPNAFGLYDMHGNVAEWCWDLYGSSYYVKSEHTDPKGPANGTMRVLRGGAWTDFAKDCRSSRRQYTSPGVKYNYYGFRVVRLY
jgi:formylglycine-generating enzyme